MVDTLDLKSNEQKCSYRFESGLGYLKNIFRKAYCPPVKNRGAFLFQKSLQA